ncbi:MAG: putative peroxiredoxin [Friedmanniella sp.]|nr:putative peroxiredoxin [Friedmanniella sp.]
MTESAPGPLALGERVPDFSSRTQHGEPITLASLAGAPAVLVFYPWAFSGICTGELQALRDAHAEITATGVRLLAVSCDAMFANRAFADQQRFGFDLLTDHWPHGAIAQAYGVFDQAAGCSLRGTFVLDAEGRLRWQVVHQIGEPRALVDLLAALA